MRSNPPPPGGPAPDDVHEDAVAAAMHAVDRRAFLPRTQRAAAADDRPLPIGHEQTCSQPSTVAAMLELLQVPRGSAVLDVGAGSGWTTALLAHLVGPGGEVLGTERVPGIASWGSANLARQEMPWARIETARTGVLGAPRPGGWARILVSAAPEDLPEELVDQLAPGGRMVIPVGQAMMLVERSDDGTVRTTEHGSYRFVPLVRD